MAEKTERPQLVKPRQDHIPETSLPNVTVGFGSLASFEFTMRAAKALANSTLVPAEYRAFVPSKIKRNEWAENGNAIPNCVVALNMAQRLGADPLMIMQNLHVIEGRPSWSSQFIIAAINSCGRFSPLRFDISEPGDETEIEFETHKWEDKQKIFFKKKMMVRHQKCTAYAIEKATGDKLPGPTVTMEMAIVEGWATKNGSKWQTMPEIMLRYRAAAFFGRLYAPELLMGLHTSEEVVDMHRTEDGTFSMTSETDAHPMVPTLDPSQAGFDPETGETDDSSMSEVQSEPEPKKDRKAREPKEDQKSQSSEVKTQQAETKAQSNGGMFGDD